MGKELSEIQKKEQKLAGIDIAEQKEPEITLLTVRIPKTQHLAFKSRCVLEGRSMQDLIRVLIDYYIHSGGRL